MLKNYFLFTIVLVCAFACNNNKQMLTADKQFGAPITAEKAITYDQLLKKMEKADSLDAKVTGKVSAVCQKKGCWMTLVSDDPAKPAMRVTFKDYAFFMPKDIAGRTVVVDGFALAETTSVADLRHYAEDAGKSKTEIEQINAPLREYVFEAKGVILVK
jgi:Domain of unknown function (DUF4920)